MHAQKSCSLYPCSLNIPYNFLIRKKNHGSSVISKTAILFPPISVCYQSGYIQAMKLQITLKSVYFCNGNISFELYFFFFSAKENQKPKQLVKLTLIRRFSTHMLLISTLNIVKIFFCQIQKKSRCKTSNQKELRVYIVQTVHFL